MAAAARRRRPAKCLGSTGSGGPTSPAARVSARVAVWGWGHGEEAEPRLRMTAQGRRHADATVTQKLFPATVKKKTVPLISFVALYLSFYFYRLLLRLLQHSTELRRRRRRLHWLAVYLAGANGGMKQEFRRTVYKLLACLMVAAVLVDRK